MNLFSIFNKDSDSVISRISSGTSWVLIGTLSSKAFVFVATILIARILPKEVYGQLSIIDRLLHSLSAFLHLVLELLQPGILQNTVSLIQRKLLRCIMLPTPLYGLWQLFLQQC